MTSSPFNEHGDSASSLSERFDRSLRALDGIEGVERVLVGCSGGADSTALLLLFDEWCRGRRDRAPELWVGHVHHGMRGADADADARFVEALARRLERRFLIERDETQRPPRGESEARELRFEAFRRWAETHSLDAIALAHHREDQQETVLLRLARGTGVRGLAGMRSRRALEGCSREVALIRPLLETSRDELRAYLTEIGQDHRSDASNEDRCVPRNVVRLDVLPLLEEKVHPGARAAIERVARQAGQLDRDLAAIADKIWRGVVTRERADRVEIDALALARWPASVRLEVLRRAELGLSQRGLSSISDRVAGLLCDLVEPDADAGRVVAGGGVFFERRRQALIVGRVSEADDDFEPTPIVEVELLVDGPEVTWGGWTLSARRDDGPIAAAARGGLVEWIDEGSVGETLSVRSRRAGDRFWPLGSSGHKKLKEFLRESDVPREERDAVPIVATDDEIVWVVGQRIGEPFRVPDGGVHKIRLEARR